MHTSIRIINLLQKHWPEVRQIYEQGIATGVATFETETPEWDDWNKSHLKVCRFVAIMEKKVVGWAALSPVSSRCVYDGVGEISIYIHQDYRGKQIGKALLSRLIGSSEEKGLWTLQAGIMPENTSSIRLHESLGFRQVGYREKIGKFQGEWKDNILMERRSQAVGLD